MGDTLFQDPQWMPETTDNTEPYIHTGIPRFIAFHFIVPCRYRSFYKLKVCGNPVSSKSFGAIFPNICSFQVSVSHFGNSCSILNFFIIIILVMVICDL